MQLSSPRRRRPLVSLTPLIDVVFILLVFFMLATNFADWRSLTLSASAATTGGSASSTSDATIVGIGVDGAVTLDGEPVALQALSVRLSVRRDDRILVRPEDDTPLQHIVSVLDLLEVAGIDNATLAPP